MRIILTISVDALFNDIWNADNIFLLPGDREDFNEKESVWAYWRMLNAELHEEYPCASISIDLAWISDCSEGAVKTNVQIFSGEKENRTSVLERVERIEDDVWSSYPDWLVRVG